MPAHKLSRKELRRDGFVNWTERTLEYLQENLVTAAIIAGVVVVLVVGASYLRSSRAQARQTASALLYQGQSLLASGSYEAARGRLQECVDRFGDGEYGEQARLSLAEAQMGLGENELALQTLGEVPTTLRPADDLYSAYLTLQATAEANLGRYDAAAERYSEALAGNLLPVQRYDLTLRRAEALHRAGRTADGLAVLEDLQRSIDTKELDLPARDLANRIEVYRALAQ